MIMTHEFGHVRWDLPSDRLTEKYPAVANNELALAFYRMMREWVVDARLTDAGLDIRPSSNLLDWHAMPDPARLDADVIARAWMQWYYRSQHPDVTDGCRSYVSECWALIDDDGRQLLAEAYNATMSALYDDDVSANYAVKLADYFGRPDQAVVEPDRPPESAAACQRRRDARRQEQTREDTRNMLEDLTRSERQRERELRDQVDPDHAKSQEFKVGVIRNRRNEIIDIPRQSIQIHRHLDGRSRGVRVKDPLGLRTHGAVPTVTENIRTGGAIFREAPRGTGTILIDVSSSMAWDDDELRAAIESAPNLTVAGYARHDAVGRMLCIVAHGGRMSYHPPCAGGGYNGGTDIPALLWLERQPSPRIIVSDGEYIPPSLAEWSGSDSDYREICTTIMRRAGIMRAPTMRDAVRYLSGKVARMSVGDDTYKPAPVRRRR
jgi:hypothetical protein